MIRLIVLFLLFSSSVFGKEYNCSYMFGEENFPLNIKQKTDYSYVLDMHYETEEYKLGETDKLLIIGAPQYVEDSKTVFRVIFLDRQADNSQSDIPMNNGENQNFPASEVSKEINIDNNDTDEAEELPW